MERFLLEHATRHQMLVQKFKPSPQKAKCQYDAPSSNITVATRIRPILDEEVSSGQVVAIFPRVDEKGIVDLHELRRVVRGFPPLKVSTRHLV